MTRAKLQARELKILEERYGGPINGDKPKVSQRELAGQLNVSVPRIRQLESRAIRKILRHYINDTQTIECVEVDGVLEWHCAAGGWVPYTVIEIDARNFAPGTKIIVVEASND